MDQRFPDEHAFVPADPGTPNSNETESRQRAVAGRRRRILAWLVDYLIIMLPGLGAVAFVVAGLIQTLPGFVGSVAANAGWSRVVQLFTQRRGFRLGDVAADEWVNYALPLLLVLVIIPAAQFAYLGIMLAWRRRTIGMMLADIRVESLRTRAPLRRGGAMVRAALTTFVETGLVAVALVLMVIGQFSLGLVLWGAAVVAFWLDAIVAIGGGRRTLIDRLVGAVAVRSGVYASAARAVSTTAVVAAQSVSATAVVAAQSVSATAAATAQTVSAGAVVAGRRAADAAATAGRAVSDAAAVGGELMRQGTAALAQTAPVQHLLDSRTATQVQAIGAAGADRAREFGGQAADRARQLGGATRSLWRQRRDARPELPAAPDPTD
jgi:RDD family protein